MSAETLRRAAALIRERAEAATGGPWHVECAHHGGGDDHVHLVLDVMRDRYGVNSVSTDDHATAAHIASWHPAVALAVAVLLEEASVAFDQYMAKQADPARRFNSLWLAEAERRYERALAVARTYLGES